ncbi:MAG: Type II secretion system protein E [Parcubacteria group bacterium GW2011_GWA2_38_13]|nr:MAG: Type II secretion system protein E [Parcubacteria group bacterium GW2011_GWA2_38_13]
MFNIKKDKNKIPSILTEDTREKFDEKMMEINIEEKEREAKKKSQELGIPYINFKGFPISPDTLTLIDEETANRLNMICFYFGNNDIRIGVIDPLNEEVNSLAGELQERNKKEVKLYIISKHSMELGAQLYAHLPRIRKFSGGVEITEANFEQYKKEIKTFRDLDAKIKTVSITDMVTLIIAAAIQSRSSDIHVETEEKAILVRYRIDGILQDVTNIDRTLWPQIIARIKLLSKLKINITDKPQDGRFTIFLSKEKIDVRVSCLPTSYGESVVMRLLMSSSAGLTFESLGLRGQAYTDLMREMTKPNGMIVTTGPTGSGKTTTLYAMLNKLNDTETKIITIEDPVEYRLEGVNQSQIDRARGYDFASGLRSILRQDPDIVMVGEIRDLETADIAINAALTGHLVLSTIHTNDASGTIPRFLAMGVKSFLLAPSLNAMIGQRLVRKICENCKEEFTIDETMRERVRKILAPIKKIEGYEFSEKQLKELKFFHGKGCDACQKLGYKGRVGIYEIMTMNPEIEQLIMSGHVSEYDMRKVSEKHGMITMLQDGILKALEGGTTLDEIFRVAKDTSYSVDIE